MKERAQVAEGLQGLAIVRAPKATTDGKRLAEMRVGLVESAKAVVGSTDRRAQLGLDAGSSGEFGADGYGRPVEQLEHRDLLPARVEVRRRLRK